MNNEFNDALEPKEIDINGCKFIIRKMPCTTAQEVLVKLPQGLIPIISNFGVAEEMAFKMLSYCERVYPDKKVALINKTIIDNHVPDLRTLIDLEKACAHYNFDFFDFGGIAITCQKFLSRAELNLSKTLTDLLDKLLQAAEQHSES